jgi:hypothetical protein
MSNDAKEVCTTLEQLNERVQHLENRIAILEGEPRTQRVAAIAQPVNPVRRERPPETWQGFPSIELPAAISTLGKAVIGLAGAYLFRALAESGTLPKAPVVALAVAYAMLWLVQAIRVHAQKFASTTYALTSILILSPMLWETTVRFEFVSPAYAGAILVGFFAVTLALSWKRELETIPWLAAVATSGTVIALFFATRDVLPLTLSVLGMALAMEVVTCSGRVLTSRMIPALSANLAVWLVITIMMFGPPAEEYPQVGKATISALWFALLAIYVGSIGLRGFLRRRGVTAVDVIQGSMAVAVAALGATRSSGLTKSMLGVVMMALAAGCYWAGLARFSSELYARNRRIFSAWGAALLIVGSVFLLGANASVVFLGAASVAMTFVYRRFGTLSLGLHPSVLLAAAAVLSSLPTFIAAALSGTVTASPDWTVMVVTVAAVLCYSIGSSVAETRIRRRALWIIPAALSAVAAVSLAVTAIVWLANGHWETSASRLSVIRTIVNCALALTLGYLGPYWRRIELGWVAYAAVAFGTLKLVFEDLRFGSPETLVFSFLFYGLVLIVLPRLARRRQTDYQHPRKYFAASA